MIHIKLSLFACFIALVTGCASTKGTSNISSAIEQQTCAFPGSDQEAPDWVCTGHVENYKTGIGRYLLSKHNHSLAFDIAQLRARTDLAHKIKTELQSRKKDYDAIAITSNGEAIDNVNNVTRRSEVDIVLEGTRVLTSLTGPNNWLYVLVGKDESLIDQSLDRVVRSSYQNPEAQYLKQVAEQEISTMKNSNNQ